MNNVFFYTTAGCHLCDQAWALIAGASLSLPVEVTVVDIADKGGLVEQYGERIPVLAKGSQELGWPFSQEDVCGLLESSQSVTDVR